MVILRLHKVTVLMLLGLLGLAGALTFSAGMVVGVHWTLTNPALEAMLDGRTEPEPAGGRAVPAVSTSPPSAAPPQVVVAPPAAASPPPAAAAVPSAPLPPAAVEPPPTPEPTAVAEAPAPDPAAAGGEPRFAVQVGAFLFEENSSRMVEDLQEWGYEPYIVKKTASDDRIFETVRFGHYPSHQQASLAASEFIERVGFEAAIVRQPGTL